MSKEIQGNMDTRQFKGDSRQGDSNVVLAFEDGLSPLTGALSPLIGPFRSPLLGEFLAGGPTGGAAPSGYTASSFLTSGSLLLTTKGDLLTRSSSALSRLGVGSDGTVLTADSAQTLGIKWAASSGSGGGGVNAQTGTTYTVVNGDNGKLVTFSNGSSIAVTLPQAGSGGNFGSTWFAAFENRGVGTVTITPTTSTIDGAASITLITNQGIYIYSDATNYFTERGRASDASLSVSDITTNNVTSSAHGFAPKTPADATQFLNGAATAAFAQVKDSDLSLSDITTNNSSTSNHGFLKKLDNTATHYMDGTGAWSTPTGSGATQDVTHTSGIYLPVVPSTSGWSWANQGSSTNATVDTALQIIIPNNASLNWRLYHKALPGSTYTIIMHGIMILLQENSCAMGLYLYDGTKIEGIELLAQTTAGFQPRVEKMNSVTSDAGTLASTSYEVISTNAGIHTTYPHFVSFKINDNGTKRTFYYSLNKGLSWIQFFQENTHTFLTETDFAVGGVIITSTSSFSGELDVLSLDAV